MNQTNQILLVDAEEAQTKLILDAFASHTKRFHIITAANLQEARTILIESTPDLLITDWTLPDGKGIDLLSSNHKKAEFPIIVMTVLDNEKAAIEAITSSALNHVIKSNAALAVMPYIAERVIREWQYGTEQNTTITKLQNEESLYLKVIENLPIRVEFYNDKLKKFTYFNSKVNWCGYTQKEWNQLSHEDRKTFIHPHDLSWVDSAYTKWRLSNVKTPLNIEYRILQKNGNYKWIESLYYKENSPDNAECRCRPSVGDCEDKTIIHFTWDIDKQMQAEEALQISINRGRSIIAAIPDMMFCLKRDGTVIKLSDEIQDKLPMTYKRILGKKIWDVGFPMNHRDRLLNLITKTLESSEIQTLEYQLDTERSIKYFEARLVPWSEDEVLAIARDITKRKMAEESLNSALKEKEVLLKEIHHRVKNNLQVISSLLDLQSSSIKDKRIAELFSESQNRIRTISLTHEQLYMSENPSKFDFAAYIRNLSNALLFSLSIKPTQHEVNIDINEVFLEINLVIPCALMINELVTNSLKYAFPGDKHGEINIRCYPGEDKKYVLTVSDNGVGFPEDLDYRNTDTLGLQLVNMFVNQLYGTIELDSSKGTEFRITFPRK